MLGPKKKKGFRLPMAIVVAVWAGILTGQGTRAAGLEGSAEPEFQAAIETWLGDNDEDSLPVFARLARDGNIAARLLLSRIEDTERAPREFVADLTRKQRVELFRAASGSGLFRPSWLRSETTGGNRTAAALLRASALEVDIEAIQNLYRIGEPEAAYDLIREAAANGSSEDKARLAGFLPQGSELAPYLRALESPEAGISPGLAALQQMLRGTAFEQPGDRLADADRDTIDAARFVEFGYQTGSGTVGFERQNRFYEGLANWIESALPTTPVANLCRRYCGQNEFDACVVTAFGMVGGYYKAIRFDSPVESLIGQARYVSSDRASGMLLRRVAAVKDASGSGPLFTRAELGEKSACLARAVDEQSGS